MEGRAGGDDKGDWMGQEIKIKEIKIPLFRLFIMNQATRTALTTNSPRPANAIPTITSFGNSDFSRASMESGSGSLNKRG